MKIAIDARLYQESGIGRYIRNLLSHLGQIDQENEYFVLLLEKDFNSITLPKNFKKVKADFHWYGLAEQLKMPSLLNKINPDITHFPHFNVPIFFKGKFIVTIHDLIHQHFNMERSTTRGPLVYKIKQLGYKKVFKNAISKSTKIITVSNYVKNELSDEWGINKEKINVTYEAVEENLVKLSKEITKEDIQKTLEKFNIKPPFIFYVGNAHPHKNVEGLIKAFEILRKKFQYLTLVLSGKDHYFWQRIKKEFKSKDIIFTGGISDLELVALYKSAQTYVLPSFEEGFGIPLLESFVCECPVVSSNKGSLKEIGEDAALYFDPKNTDEMVSKISEVLNSNKLKQDLIKKGNARYQDFSWKKLAKETLNIYEKSN